MSLSSRLITSLYVSFILFTYCKHFFFCFLKKCMFCFFLLFIQTSANFFCTKKGTVVRIRRVFRIFGQSFSSIVFPWKYLKKSYFFWYSWITFSFFLISPGCQTEHVWNAPQRSRRESSSWVVGPSGAPQRVQIFIFVRTRKITAWIFHDSLIFFKYFWFSKGVCQK